MIDQLQALFVRDLDRLVKEISLYPSDGSIWTIAPGTSNSAGTLAIHIAGNLRHFIGSALGKSGYVRDRHAEFSDRDIPRDEIISRIELARVEVSAALSTMPPERLAEVYPIPVFGTDMRTDFFLMHLQGHLNYHLGQVNYHRRMLTMTD